MVGCGLRVCGAGYMFGSTYLHGRGRCLLWALLPVLFYLAGGLGYFAGVMDYLLAGVLGYFAGVMDYLLAGVLVVEPVATEYAIGIFD